MENKPRKITIRDFDDLEEESKMCPGNLQDEVVLAPKNALEAFFIDVADKHGVLDEMFSERADDPEYFEDERDF
jgi:hypothetical protein